MSNDTHKSLNRNLSECANSASKSHLSWKDRAFSKMEGGAIRSNIFLMIVSTMGCSFFFLPYYAKKVGLLTVIFLTCLPAGISYYSSKKLYQGFKETKAKTYDECMKSILGPKIGYFSNVAVFLHTFSKTIGSWIFSYKLITTPLGAMFGIQDFLVSNIFKNLYFLLMMLILFVSSISGGIEALKSISVVGIGIVLYIVLVFAILCPTYYHYYNTLEPIKIDAFIFNMEIFEVYGICQYLFLNQYTVVPICNNIKQITSKRVNKVIGRTTVILLSIALITLMTGYFSMPNLEVVKIQKHNELFLLRKPIPGHADMFIMYGVLLYGVYMVIGMLVKGRFLLIYFDQLVSNTLNFIKGDKIQPLDGEDLCEVPAEMRKTKKITSMKTTDYKENESHDGVEIYIEPIEESYAEETNENVPNEQDTLKKHIMSLGFLVFTTLLTILLSNKLKLFLSIAGGYIAIVELIIFPLLMILAINSKRQIMGKMEKYIVIVVSFVLTITGFLSASMAFYNKVFI